MLHLMVLILFMQNLSKKQVLESKFCENVVADAMKFSGFCEKLDNLIYFKTNKFL